MKKISKVKLRKGLIIGGTILGSVSAGAGIVAGVVVPLALKARDGLSKFISYGGDRISLEGKKSLNVVAMGDSVTSGYNGYLDEPQNSYSDFFVQSLRNAGLKVNYKNFGKKGLRLVDMWRPLPAESSTLEKADLITVTIGANDILAALKFFHVPFALKDAVLGGAEPIVLELQDNGTPATATQIKATWDKIIGGFKLGTPFPDDKSGTRGPDANMIFTKDDSKAMFDKSIQDMIDIASGKSGNFLNLAEGFAKDDKIFKLIKRFMATFVRDLHEIAPHARIVILGHPLPFSQFPKKVLDTINPNNNHRSLRESFDKLLQSMKEGAETSLGTNKFVDFWESDQLPHMKGSFKKLDMKSAAKFATTSKENPMPNILDIHPSIYGAAQMGAGLFEIYGKEIGISDADIKTHTAKSVPFDGASNPAFERNDENPSFFTASYGSASNFYKMLDTYTNPKQAILLKGLLKIIKTYDINNIGGFNVFFKGLITKYVTAFVKDPSKTQKISGVVTTFVASKEGLDIAGLLKAAIVSYNHLTTNHKTTTSEIEYFKHSLTATTAFFALSTQMGKVINELVTNVMKP